MYSTLFCAQMPCAVVVWLAPTKVSATGLRWRLGSCLKMPPQELLSSSMRRLPLSHAQRGPLLDVIQRDRFKDRAVGYSLHGVHRDDLEMMLGDYQMKREGSQGQTKTFVLALKLAQFDFLRRTASQTTPLLLLDDIFDKLDSHRVEQIVKLVSGDGFGQIFITDTNREHLDRILDSVSYDYRLFDVKGGEIVPHQQTNK